MLASQLSGFGYCQEPVLNKVHLLDLPVRIEIRFAIPSSNATIWPKGTHEFTTNDPNYGGSPTRLWIEIQNITDTFMIDGYISYPEVVRESITYAIWSDNVPVDGETIRPEPSQLFLLHFELTTKIKERLPTKNERMAEEVVAAKIAVKDDFDTLGNKIDAQNKANLDFQSTTRNWTLGTVVLVFIALFGFFFYHGKVSGFENELYDLKRRFYPESGVRREALVRRSPRYINPFQPKVQPQAIQPQKLQPQVTVTKAIDPRIQARIDQANAMLQRKEITKADYDNLMKDIRSETSRRINGA